MISETDVGLICFQFQRKSFISLGSTFHLLAVSTPLIYQMAWYSWLPLLRTLSGRRFSVRNIACVADALNLLYVFFSEMPRFWTIFSLGAPVDCRIRGSASVAIRRRLKTSRQIYKQLLALKEFSQSIFSFRKRLHSSNCSFIVYCERSLPTPFSKFWHVTAPNRHADT